MKTGMGLICLFCAGLWTAAAPVLAGHPQTPTPLPAPAADTSFYDQVSTPNATAPLSSSSPSSSSEAPPPGTIPLLMPAPSGTAPVPSGSGPGPVGSADRKTSVSPALKDVIEKQAPTQSNDNSVESFFQIRQTAVPPAAPVSVSKSQSANREAADESGKGSVHRFLWHLLDNIGIPLVVKPADSDLDPSINRAYMMPVSKMASQSDTATKLDHSAASTAAGSPAAKAASATTESYPPTSQTIHQKIPESELEGTIYDLGKQ